MQKVLVGHDTAPAPTLPMLTGPDHELPSHVNESAGLATLRQKFLFGQDR